MSLSDAIGSFERDGYAGRMKKDIFKWAKEKSEPKV